MLSFISENGLPELIGVPKMAVTESEPRELPMGMVLEMDSKHDT